MVRRRIARELGVHRETVGRYVRLARDGPESAGVIAGSAEAKPAKVLAGSEPPGEPKVLAGAAVVPADKCTHPLYSSRVCRVGEWLSIAITPPGVSISGLTGDGWILAC